MVNVELLDATMEHIRNNPQKWRQASWYMWVDEAGRTKYQGVVVDVEEVNSCGSAMCFAGHAALKSGFPAPPKSNFQIWSAKIDGKDWDVSDFARMKLGLTWDQSDVLFSGDNSMEDLETLVALLKENPEATEEDMKRAIDRWYDEGEDEDEDEEGYCCEYCNPDGDDEDTF